MTTAITTDTDLPLDNDVEYEVLLDHKDSNTGRWTPSTGLTGLTYHISLIEGGPDVGGTSAPLVERALRPGCYFGFLDADAAAVLTPYIGRAVYGVLSRTGDLRSIRRYVVRSVRRVA